LPPRDSGYPGFGGVGGGDLVQGGAGSAQSVRPGQEGCSEGGDLDGGQVPGDPAILGRQITIGQLSDDVRRALRLEDGRSWLLPPLAGRGFFGSAGRAWAPVAVRSQ